MKEVSEYKNFSLKLIAEFSIFETEARNFRVLFETIFNKNGTATYASDFTDEELRELIAITRAIRSSMFDSIDTHILTIEHLADLKLCRRRAIDRDNKAKMAKVQPIDTGKLSSMKPAPKTKMEQLFELMNKATPEQLQQALDNAKKGQ